MRHLKYRYMSDKKNTKAACFRDYNSWLLEKFIAYCIPYEKNIANKYLCIIINGQLLFLLVIGKLIFFILTALAKKGAVIFYFIC